MSSPLKIDALSLLKQSEMSSRFCCHTSRMYPAWTELDYRRARPGGTNQRHPSRCTHQPDRKLISFNCCKPGSAPIWKGSACALHLCAAAAADGLMVSVQHPAKQTNEMNGKRFAGSLARCQRRNWMGWDSGIVPWKRWIKIRHWFFSTCSIAEIGNSHQVGSFALNVQDLFG